MNLSLGGDKVTIGDRIKVLRKELDINQTAFGSKIGLKQAAIGLYENNQRTVSDRCISDICREFLVNEEWLRNGIGETFVEPTTFSLDEYAKSHELRESEINLIRGFMELDKNTRNALYELFNKAFENERQAVSSSQSSIVSTELSSTVEELEEEYKKSVLKNASKPVRSASNITEGTKIKEA